jgi:hypothetical protein
MVEEQNPNYYLDLIAEGESQTVEFKRRFTSERIIARVLTSFANTNGGHLFIGLNDSGEPGGLSQPEVMGTLSRLKKMCSSLFSHPYWIEEISLMGHRLIHIKVDKAPEHLRPITTADGKIYLRRGEQSIEVKHETRTSEDIVVKANKSATKNLSKHIEDTIIKENRSIQSRSSKGTKKKKITGFVAMSFRDEEEPSLVDYFMAMRRAAERTGYPIEITRMDLQEGDYEISGEIMNQIDQADFVIGDFTLSSRNVYFEVGYARGVPKRILQTSRADVELEFDVRNWKTIVYRNATELEEKLIPELKAIYEDQQS